MYRVAVDLHLVYVPPMDENGSGIIVTKTLELPFVPYEGVNVYSRQWDDCPEPHGIGLKEIVWDIDRQVFLATAHHIHEDFPIACLPAELREWVRRGWRIGSYMDAYREEDAEEATRAQNADDESPFDDVDSDLSETLHTLPPKRRPAAFNTFFKSLIRQMSATYRNQAVAYAMDKTGCYLGPGGAQSDDEAAVQKWKEYFDAFRRMSFDEQYKWTQKVEKYPDVRDAVLGTVARSGAKE